MPTVRRFRITINGKVFEVEAQELGQEVQQQAPATPAVPTPSLAPARPATASAPASAQPKAQATGGAGTRIEAPLPGLVLDVKVKEGDPVSSGQVLVILEAMKMENEIVAPEDGTVGQIAVGKGDSVSSGDVLVVLH